MVREPVGGMDGWMDVYQGQTYMDCTDFVFFNLCLCSMTSLFSLLESFLIFSLSDITCVSIMHQWDGPLTSGRGSQFP